MCQFMEINGQKDPYVAKIKDKCPHPTGGSVVARMQELGKTIAKWDGSLNVT